MKVNVIGGGPGGLFYAILHKKAHPADEVTVFERNRADDTFGFGVVLSAATLGNVYAADHETYTSIERAFAYWDDIYTHFRGHVLKSAGHAFSGVSRLKLLQILQDRAQALGVTIHYEHDVADLAPCLAADLVVAADGINSRVREGWKAHFRPHTDLRPNKFTWLGAQMTLPGFTYVFKNNEHGVWTAHAYQYEPGMCTVVAETTDEAFAAAGLETENEAKTVAYLEEVFAGEFGRGKLITNRSYWRNFPMMRLDTWVKDNVVLLGDAAHTAHFSIGSGTKLAMESAIALAEAVDADYGDLPKALAAFDTTRRDEVERTQHAADVSLVWFENVKRLWDVDPEQFNFSLLSRSKQITYENLRERDPSVVEQVDRWYTAKVAKAEGLIAPEPPVPPMFTPFRLRDMVVPNRVVVSPMCQYSATDGMPNDWHLMHLGARAVGGAGLVVTEMTCIAADARISPGCAGIWSDEQAAQWRRITDFVHAHSAAKIALQIGHAGRKGSTQLAWERIDRPLPTGNWPIYSASPLPYFPGESQVPIEMTEADMARVKAQFVAAAQAGERSNFDMLELHLAHGYLLASFISPLTNRRTDGYGGGLEARMRYPLEVLDAVRAAWPEHKPLSVRISATDWAEGGLDGPDAVEIAKMLKAHGTDLVDVSTGQTDPASKPFYGRMYQTPFAEAIRLEAGIATMAVGAITSADQVNTIVASGRADLCALARPHLTNPHFTLQAAAEYGVAAQPWPPQYIAGKQQAESLALRAKQDEAARAVKPPPMRPAAVAAGQAGREAAE
ncbi:MAG: bifunctional salicylyl-CoA 5-hydroxylase/oxidoreductase [Sneathiellaceae bacterium]